MPDVVLYSEEKNWLYFIESVTSVGPMEPKRIKEIEEMTIGVTAGQIYVTAFLDFKTFKKFSETLAWETEVWIADMPDHMIHLNAGMRLRLECQSILQGREIPEGKMIVCDGYNLPCQKVITTVGPQIQGKVMERDKKALANCYQNALCYAIIDCFSLYFHGIIWLSHKRG